RADVDVSYRIYLRSDVLAPGIARDAVAPGTLQVVVPREGVLRLRSRGESDVRCRLFDAAGRRIAASASVGEDWNCAFAEPVKAGQYTLSLESETLEQVITHVGIAMPKIETAPPLADGQTLKIGTLVIAAPVPLPAAAQGDVVQEVTLKSAGAAFSCDVSGKDGVIARQSEVKDCSFLLRGKGEALQIRAWLVERSPTGPVSVQVHVASRPVTAGSGKVPGDGATLATLAHEGRYKTSPDIFCLPEPKKGVLEPCGPEVSLEKGPVVFAAFGAKDAKLPLDEIVLETPAAPTPERVRVANQPLLQLQRSSGKAVHLLRATGLSGERSDVACALGPGSRVMRDNECFAASGVGEEAVARVWTAGEEGDAELTRFAVKLPQGTLTLVAGQQSLTWPAWPARLVLPAQPARIELTLPPQTWAVQLDGTGRAVDLCPPEKDLARCVFATRGGEIALWGEGERRADAILLLGAAPARAHLTAGLFEAAASVAGALEISVPAAESVRRLEVQGARTCTLRLAGGVRIAGCVATIPAGQSGELLVTHEGRPVRAMTHAAESFLDGYFPLLVQSGGPTPPAPAPLLALGRAVPLVGGQGWTEFSLSFEKPAVVHVRGQSGVCALVAKEHVVAVDGLGAGCELHWLVAPGVYRLVARPFGDQPLTGTIAWTQTEVEPIAEGVGSERWIAPGEAKLFRFTLASAGRVGIGLQEPAETLRCAVRNPSQAMVGDGCQQFLKLEAGSYLLEVSAPASVRTTRFRPVVVGLSGAKMEVPEQYLRDFFQRIGGVP
ncbi:MAG: hypothetical protein HY901_11580, partial [Deltaproteobacteria bacterium]|nr:hypothetical protein [Deltaproteobacteria bacterium]